MKWFCKGDRLDFSTKLLPDDVRITFKQESTGSPKSVDFILKNASQAETMKGIYELKADVLKVCVHVQAAKAQEGPADFKTKSESNLCLFILKRDNQVPKTAETPPPPKPADPIK